MVQVAAGGRAAAAGSAAARAASVDQVLELAAGPVSPFGLGVVTGAADDRVERDVHHPQELRDSRVRRVGRAGRAGAWWAGAWWAGAWRPGAAAGGAAMGGGGAVGVQDG